MDRRQTLAWLAAAAAAPAAHAAPQKLRLTLASGYPPIFSMVQDMQSVFMPTVNQQLQKDARYEVEWNAALSGTLAKIPAMLDATSNGLCDVGHVPPVFEPAKLGLCNVCWYTPFTGIDHRVATSAMHQLMQQNAAYARMFTGLNLVYLSSASLDEYVLFSKKRIAGFADLKGMKVGGAGPNLTWIEGTGAVGVVTTGAGAYNDLKSGVIDALLSPAALGFQGKYYEVAPNILRAGLGAVSTTYLFANKGSHDKLPREVQQALHAAGDAWQEAHMKTQDRLVKEAFDGMRAQKAVVTELPAEARQAWARSLPPLAANWVKTEEAAGRPGREVLQQYLAQLQSRGASVSRDWTKG